MSKLLNTFLLMLLTSAILIVALGIYVSFTFSKLAGHTGVILRENYDSVAYMDEALHAVDQEERLLLQILASRTISASDRKRIMQLQESFETAMKAEENNITLPGEGDAARNLRSAYKRFRLSSDSLLSNEALDKSSTATLRNAYSKSIAPASEDVRQAAEQIRKMNHDNMENAARRQTQAAPRLVIGGIIGASLILILLGLVLGKRLLRQASELQALRAHFLAIASHELRTPVTSLRMGLDVLSSQAVGELNEEQNGVVKAGLEDCDRLLNLSRQLLDVTKIQSGQLELHLLDADLKRIISDAIASLQKIIQEHKVTIRLDTGGELPVNVQADPIKLGWVLSNVLGNALRYAPAGSEISVTANRKKNEVWISVSDEGPGIPVDLARIVFSSYYQGPSGTRGAIGLGLSISQEIIAAHGGRIWIEPQPRLGDGTTITFSIPMAEKG